jgi:hypothetical protein
MVENIGGCVLNLKLISEDPQGKRDALDLELTVSQFYEIFSELQKIKSMMEYVN